MTAKTKEKAAEKAEVIVDKKGKGKEKPIPMMEKPTPNPYPEQFSRESALPRDANPTLGMSSTIMIIGLGGIGNWAAQLFSRVSNIKKIIMFDNDILEATNLNRSSYLYSEVGEFKVQSLATMITDARIDIDLYPINALFNAEWVDEAMSNEDMVAVFNGETITVIDCRDDYYDDYGLFDVIKKKCNCEFRMLRLAYNGSSITVDMRPEAHPVAGVGGYTIVPSHIAPSSMVAILGLIYAGCYKDITEGLKYLYDIPLTFDIKDVPNYLFIGAAVDKLPEDEKNKLVVKLIKTMLKG